MVIKGSLVQIRLVCKRRDRARKHDVIAPKKEGITHSRGVMGFTRTHLAVMVEKMVRKKAEKSR
jgi:hypothetical protein